MRELLANKVGHDWLFTLPRQVMQSPYMWDGLHVQPGLGASVPSEAYLPQS